MEKQQQEKCGMWALSVDVWKEAACVTQAMQDAIGGLRDADGDPLPDVAKQFLLDLLFLCRKRPFASNTAPVFFSSRWPAKHPGMMDSAMARHPKP